MHLTVEFYDSLDVKTYKFNVQATNIRNGIMLATKMLYESELNSSDINWDDIHVEIIVRGQYVKF